MGKRMGVHNPQQQITTGVFTWNIYVALKRICSDDGKLIFMPYQKIVLIKVSKLVKHKDRFRIDRLTYRKLALNYKTDNTMSLQKEQLKPPITDFYETFELTTGIQLRHSEKASFRDLLKVNDKSYKTF